MNDNRPTNPIEIKIIAICTLRGSIDYRLQIRRGKKHMCLTTDEITELMGICEMVEKTKTNLITK